MFTNEETVCCKENYLISNVIGTLDYITHHESCMSIILNMGTLSTALYANFGLIATFWVTTGGTQNLRLLKGFEQIIVFLLGTKSTLEIILT